MVEMSTSADFPGNCITNSYILHDFAEIAYIVCTHAIPASTGNTPDPNSPEQILARLKNAEKQFRQASILVALDAGKLELFTFYKKVDVVRDQRTILSKFGLVCRLNSCIIARKSTARVLELLKPESSRVYQLFTSAILHSIHLSPKVSGVVIPVGSRRYLIPVDSEDGLRSDKIACRRNWQLYRIDLQVTAGGQVILTVQRSRNGVLHQLIGNTPNNNVVERAVRRGSIVYLVPTGQLARYVGKWDKELLPEGMKEDSPQLNRAKQSWAPTVTAWLRQYPTTHVHTNGCQEWIEIEVPVLEHNVDSHSTGDRTLSWKTICWPSALTFVVESTNTADEVSESMAVGSDPLSIIHSWYVGAAEGDATNLNAEPLSQERSHQTDEEPSFSDDVTFEEPDSAHLFGPSTFPVSQTIYPTPPEGALAQYTPGMSMDGIAPTPVHANHILPIIETPDEVEMRDIVESRPISAKDGVYEDDLFEELPDENFESGGVGEEPNWDFFDEPGFEVNHDGSGNGNDRMHHPGMHEKINNALVPNIDGRQAVFTSLPVPSDHIDSIQDVSEEALNNGAFRQAGGDIRMEDLAYESRSPPSPTFSGKLSNAKDTLLPLPNQVYANGGIRMGNSSMSTESRSVERRSSMFDGIAPALGSPKHDQKYQMRGKYWFHHASTANHNKAIFLSNRPVSTSSTSSTASDGSDSPDADHDSIRPSPIIHHPWTKFEPPGTVQNSSVRDEHDVTSAHTYVSEILDVIKVATGNEPFLFDLKSSASPHKQVFYDHQRASMIAQILVEQVSQSTLYRGAKYVKLYVNASLPLVKLSMDHSEAKQAITNANLAEVTFFTTGQSSASTRLKITKVESPRVHVKRMDKVIKISPLALSYWETLGLQPLYGQKDVTAFCLHPSSSNISDGCAAFMTRIADMYSGCNLGIHDIGRVAGITNNGLVPWFPASSSAPTLRSVCQKLGEAVSLTASLDTTILIYMVSPVETLSCYRDVCHAFTILFDSFVKASHQNTKRVELALQIVPVSFIASADILVIPSQESYLELVLEVYNRLPPRTESQQLGACGTAVILDKLQPKEIGFDLNPSVVDPIHKNGECLHLAYSYSFDGRWLTAAWSDERGTISLTMSYSLRGAANHDESMRPRREVLRDLWDISHDIMEKQRSRWRLVVARSDFYEDDELRDWLSFINQNNSERKAIARLILLSVLVEPGTLLQPPAFLNKGVHIPPAGHGLNLSATPVSTPQTITTSPDQGIAATPTSTFQPANAPTPPDHNVDTSLDHEVTLFDPNEECWSAVFAFGVNQSHDPLSIRPAAASGLLIKRTDNKEDASGLTAVEVHLVATSRLTQAAPTQVERETLLDNILVQFRRLATLAVTRGCIDQDRECVPWHIATAVRGSRILGEAM